MIESILEAIQTLSQRIAVQESRPYNPYLPDAQMFDHFAGDGTIDARWTTTVTGSGSVTIPNATPTIARIATGATAGSAAQLDWGANYSLVGANKWLTIMTRFAITTAIDNDDEIGFRLRSATPDTIDLGVYGASSTAFFVARSTSGGGGTVVATVTTVPVDTSYHDWMIQMFPDRIRFYIDNVQVAEHTTGVTTSALRPSPRAYNGANGGSRTMDVDLVWVREAR